MTADRKKNGSPLPNSDHLRLRAEQVLRSNRNKPTSSVLSDMDVRKQLHELQVNQLELTLQNSELMELQRARQEIELLLARYTDLYEFAPIGYFTLGRDSTLHEVNLTGVSLIGLVRSKMVGRLFGAFVAIESRATFNAFLTRVFAGEAKQSCEVRLLNAVQQSFYARIEANADANEQTCRLVVEDISARKSAEQALHNTQEELESRVLQRTSALLQANAQLGKEIGERKRTEEALKHTEYILQQAQRVAHVGSWERDIASGAVRWSDEFFRICGYPPQAFTPSMTKALKPIHPEDRKAVYRAVRRSIEFCQGFSRTVRIVRPNGTIRFVRLQGDVLDGDNGKPKTLVGSVLDITEYKNTEEALLQSQETIRRLAAHQEWVKENERKRIAREIHDELGQNLLALRIDVSMLAARTGHSHPRLNAKVKATLSDIDVTIKSVRGIINNLRPAVLDLGLPAAFEWQVKEFQRRSGIACTLNISGTDEDYTLDDDPATALFRILQESLTNVSRHAHADRITISLSKDAHNVVMKVADNGIGLPQDSRRKVNSYGLIGISERVNTLRGELIIDSRENQGTSLTVIIPAECPTPWNAA
ncbi:MAG: PAS domain-containing protein [Oxalobacteraceae bacterium]